MSKNNRSVVFLRIDPSLKAAISEQCSQSSTSIQQWCLDAITAKLQPVSDLNDKELADGHCEDH